MGDLGQSEIRDPWMLLEESEKKYLKIAETLFHGVFEADDSGSITFASPRTLAMFKFGREDIKRGLRVEDVIATEHQERSRRGVRRILAGEKRLYGVFNCIRKDGSIFPALIMTDAIMVDGRSTGVRGVIIDVTHQKQMFREFRESESLYRTLFETTGTATIISDEKGRALLVNAENEKITGYRKDEMIGKPLKEFIHKDDLEMMVRYHNARLKDPSSAPKNYEFRMIRKDGSMRDIFITVDIIPGTKSVIASLVDITERKKMENALRESECMYRTLFEATGTVMMILEDDMTISLANDEFYRVSGYHGKELKKVFEFIHDDDRDRMVEWLRIRRTNSHSAPRTCECRYVMKTGEVRDGLIHVAMIPGKNGSIASIVDISQIKRAEEALKKNKDELEIKSQGLEEANAALRVLLKHREEDRHVLEERVLANVKELVLPYVEKLRATRLSAVQRNHVEVIDSSLNDILSPFLHGLTSRYSNLTPKELQIINFIREGRTTKEIAALMNASARTIDFHRNNIRKKMGIKRRSTNLRTFLIALQ